ncbi:3-hydroxyacyl-CoA dehydrogenase NAD-binding domain-containing protein [Aurantimonas sp. MSK8Z-1]|uniref:3-hydroxyacyl-CoA dehydrogenase NAD-binding domain-containing protein n=1 Tax=Mangrovibrevibacter kandeliae TaxID=2968473 RepID=UPI002118B951|nr:3-hydroxyacyl-CoA dehydrogenase NAD-binding domain-containing protein [Aurantimonas sp. MSK8Z-1]MCW4113425.1 3-hydroxyacyl-CoA dehydrogenase NAD-binding domain-containing protein [Aurantimonas sp. MSK8Z-1]
MQEIRTVAVVGTGIIGASWSCLFLAHGLDVMATDIREGAEAELNAAVERFWPSLPDAVLARGERGTLRFASDLAAACAAADFVQENAIERQDAKIELMRRIDAAAPAHAVIASSSSAISVTAMQSACADPGRVVLGHPFNPPHLVPLVEVAGGEATRETALATAEAFYGRVGKVPIRLNKELYGHVANRLQAAIFREAVHLLESGVASAEDIDRAVSEGPGLRWALMGPFLTYHLAGGERGMAGFWEMFAPMQQRLWDDLGNPVPDAGVQARVTEAVERSYAGRPVRALVEDRDIRLRKVLAARRLDREP